MDNELRGVRGWLAVLVAVLFVIRPLLLLFSTLAELSAAESANAALAGMPTWGTAKAITWIFAALQIFCCAAGGWLLMRRFKASTVTIVIALLWFCGPLLSLAGSAAIAVALRLDFSSAIAPSELAKYLFFAIIWTTYLKRSVRVRNTYSEDTELEQLGDTFA
jgi:hypothetical protein